VTPLWRDPLFYLLLIAGVAFIVFVTALLIK
jgi:hypothetical protein